MHINRKSEMVQKYEKSPVSQTIVFGIENVFDQKIKVGRLSF